MQVWLIPLVDNGVGGR